MNKCLHCGKPVKNKYCNISCQNIHQQKGKKKNKKSIDKRSESIKNKWKTFIVKCNKCSKEFEIKEFNVLEPKKEKYYCSRSCANSHIRSIVSKEKLSNKVINNYELYKKCVISGIKKSKQDVNQFILNYGFNDIDDYVKHLINTKNENQKCEFCGNEFQLKKKNQKFCSRLCSSKTNIKIMQEKYKKIIDEKIKENPNYWSEYHKKLYADGKNYIAGGTCKWIEVETSNGLIKVQGTYEKRMCNILDIWKTKNIIKNWEYTNDKYKYIGIDKKEHTYLLDFKVIQNDGNFYYIETKGYIKENDEFKWNTVRNLGYRLDIIFKKDLEKIEKELLIKK